MRMDALLLKCTINESYDNFLLHYSSSISEPRSGFRIAFNMFDTDGNQRVDKKEFRVVSMT